MPSYFDFVRQRNFLTAEGASYVANSEYSEPRAVGRARAALFDGSARLMLYSERAHFYRRHRLRGVRRVVFYGPPSAAHFYAELLNLLVEGEGARVEVLFTRWDALALERLVGSARAAKMLASKSPAFVFC